MQTNFILKTLLAVLCSCSSCVAQTTSHPVEFKIKSDVFLSNQTQPVSSNTTLFFDKLVYDFRYSISGSQPEEVAVYDSVSKKVTLLDYKRQLRLELDTLQLVRLVEGMKSELENNPNLNAVFLEGFEQSVDYDKNLVTLSNAAVHYTAQGVRPARDEILVNYFSFLDLFTKVGATDPRTLPPFPRLLLNAEIQKIGFIPEKITLKISPTTGWNRRVDAYSVHQLEMNLSPSDKSLASTAKANWTGFKKVGIEKYRQIKVAKSLDLNVNR